MAHRSAALALVTSLAVVGSGLLVVVAQSTAAAPADPLPAVPAPHVAFTDDRDAIERTAVARDVPVPGIAAVAAPVGLDGFHAVESDAFTPRRTVDHEGEAGSADTLATAYVSTVGSEGPVPSPTPSAPTGASGQDADGEVWLRYSGPGTDFDRRITQDAAHESHPQARWFDIGGQPPRRLLRIAFASDLAPDGQQATGDWNIWVADVTGDFQAAPPSVSLRQVTTGPGNDLWPSWTVDGRIVFSSTRDDPDGDLYAVALPALGAPPTAAAARLTDSPGADLHPAVQPVTTGAWVAFERATAGGRGLRFLRLEAPDVQLDPVAPETTEPAWSPDGAYLAMTTRATDPAGDIAVAGFRPPAAGVTTDAGALVGTSPVLAQPGRSESSASWERGFDAQALLLATVDQEDADVSAVRAADGSGRTTPAAGAADDRQPAWSPDGTRVAWSADDEDGGRHLVVAAADGSSPVALPADRGGGDVDVQPAWSPDGTRIAFTRYAATETSYAQPKVWVADPLAGTAEQVSVVPPGEPGISDEQPTWSPDGQRLAITRRLLRPDIVVTVAATPQTLVRGHDTSIVATVANEGAAPASDVALSLRWGPGLVAPPPIIRLADATCGPVSTTEINCPVGDLAPGRTEAVTVVRRGEGLGPQQVTAVATTATRQTSTSNDSATVTVTVVPEPVDLTVTLTPPDASGGTTVTQEYTARVANLRPDPARDVVLTFTLAAGLNTPPGFPCANAVPIVVRRPISGPVTSAVDRIERITVTGRCGGTYPVTASVTTSSSDVNPTNDSDTSTLTVTIIKIRGPAPTAVRSAPLLPVPPTPALALPEPPPPDSGPQVWVVPADGSAAGSAVTSSAAGCTSECTLSGRSPAWSPDGTQIAYQSFGAADVAAGTVRVATLAGSGPEPRFDAITSVTDPAALEWSDDPAWSPDGSELAVTGQPAGQPAQLGVFALRPDGTGLRPLAQSPRQELEPDWQASADLGVTVTAAPAALKIGQPSEITATVGNDGPARAAGAVLEVAVPPGLEVVVQPLTGCTLTSATVTCGPSTLARGERTGVTFTARATAVGTHPVTAQASARTPDPDPTDNQDSTAVTVSKLAADVSVDVELTGSPALVGDPVGVTMTVRNAGPDPAQAVTLAMTRPAGAAVSAVSTPSCDDAGTACSLGTLAPGATVVVGYSATWAAPASGEVRGTVATTTSDSVPGNDTDAERVVIGQAPPPPTTPPPTAPPPTAPPPTAPPPTAPPPTAPPPTAPPPTVPAPTAPPPTVPPSTAPPPPTPGPPAADLGVDVSLDRSTAYGAGTVRATFTVRNAGPDPSRATLRTSWDAGLGAVADSCAVETGCDLGTLAPGGSRSRQVDLEVTTASRSGTVAAVVTSSVADPDPGDDRASAALTVVLPRLTLSPSVGPPGTVTMALGEGFPPGAQVRLRWSPGLTPFTGSVPADATGTFVVPILVLRRDILGERVLQGRQPASAEVAFAATRAEFLVVPRSQEPPDFLGRG